MGEGAHCVAYRAQKVMFFISRSEVIGRNCEVSAQVLPEVGGLYHIEVNVPLRGFSSGDADRDRDVMHLLKVEKRPELTFRTKALSAEGWRKLFATKVFDIEGELFIGDKTFPLKLRTHYSENADVAEVDGVASVAFKDFAMSPPTVAAGVVARAKPDLELHFHLLSQRILGADSIRLGPER
ncbi:MAG: YceI family protein [Calothrix sp. SM1_5_4]|nr:YceI family protein [Calothrix sp. SM1_5_4]